MKLGVAIVGLGNRWEGQYLPAIRSLADRFDRLIDINEVLKRED